MVGVVKTGSRRSKQVVGSPKRAPVGPNRWFVVKTGACRPKQVVCGCVKLGILTEMSGLKLCEALAPTCRLRRSLDESWLALLLTIYRPLSTGHCAQCR